MSDCSRQEKKATSTLSLCLTAADTRRRQRPPSLCIRLQKTQEEDNVHPLSVSDCSRHKKKTTSTLSLYQTAEDTRRRQRPPSLCIRLQQTQEEDNVHPLSVSDCSRHKKATCTLPVYLAFLCFSLRLSLHIVCNKC